MPSIIATGREIWRIYGLLTFVAIGLILFTGLSLWESVNLAMTTVSTGGFTIHDGGIAFYHNFFLELLLIPIMIAGALPFKVYYLIKEKRRWSLFGNEQVKLFFLFAAIGTALLACDVVFFSDREIFSAIEQGLFMTEKLI